MKTTLRPLVAAMLADLAGCGQIGQQSTLAKPGMVDKPQVAGVGDTVMDIRLTESLPNVAGKADLFGRTRDAGRVVVRYAGLEGGPAVFIRQDILIQSNDTTMPRTPLFLPNTQTTTMTGNVGAIPVNSTSTTIGSPTYIPAARSSNIVVPAGAMQISAPPGGSLIVEGQRINVLRAIDGGIDLRKQGREEELGHRLIKSHPDSD